MTSASVYLVLVEPLSRSADGRRGIKLPPAVIEIIKQAVRDYKAAHAIQDEVSAAIGGPISTRTVGRWLAAIRMQNRAKDIALDSSIAIAACGDDAVALSKLAASIILERGWMARRIESLDKSFRLFLKEPSPKNMTVLRVEAMTFVLESQLSKHLSFPLDRREPARVDAARPESTSVLPVAARVSEAPPTEGSNTK